MTYQEAITVSYKRYIDDLIDRFNHWNNDNAEPDDLEFHEVKSYYDGAISIVTRRKCYV